MGDMPPMDIRQPQDFGNEMDGMSPPQMADDMNMDNQFDTNFDAGVEANEEEDPKKFIQQLTGKLSQSLRKYNEDNGKADVDLNKYVAGMIVKQAIEGLNENDVEEILNKVKSDEEIPMEDGQNTEEQPPSDDVVEQPNESIKRGKNRRNLEEIVNNVLHNKEENVNDVLHNKQGISQQKNNKNSFVKKPFSSPNFE